MTEKNIIETIREMALDYECDAVNTVSDIEDYLKKQGYTKGGGEMSRVDRWERNRSVIYLAYDPERGNISISQ